MIVVAQADDQQGLLAGGLAQAGHPLFRALRHPEVTRHQKHAGIRLQEPGPHLIKNFTTLIGGRVQVKVGGDEDFIPQPFLPRAGEILMGSTGGPELRWRGSARIRSRNPKSQGRHR